MKNFLIAFLVFLIWSVFGLWLYSLLQNTSNTSSIDEIDTVNVSESPLSLEKNEIVAAFDTTSKTRLSSTTGISVEKKRSEKNKEQAGLIAEDEEGTTVFKFSEGIAILKNSTEIDIPKNLENFKNLIYDFLSTHPDTEVHIHSIYSPNENIETPNLGITRGLKIKEALLANGIREEQLVIKPTIKDVAFNNEGTFSNAISFQFKPLNEKRIEDHREALPAKKVIYPTFSTSGIQIDETLTLLLSEIKEISKTHPELKIQVVGHTDNVGNAEDNYKLGLMYAQQVRWFLITKGKIDRDRINAVSRGESDAIDTNKSKRGRIANRRIEILFM